MPAGWPWPCVSPSPPDASGSGRPQAGAGPWGAAPVPTPAPAAPHTAAPPPETGRVRARGSPKSTGTSLKSPGCCPGICSCTTHSLYDSLPHISNGGKPEPRIPPNPQGAPPNPTGTPNPWKRALLAPPKPSPASIVLGTMMSPQGGISTGVASPQDNGITLGKMASL